MKVQRALLTLAISASLLSAGTGAAAAEPKENADQFVARVNKELREDYVEQTAAQWLSETYINDDSQLVASKANERALVKLGNYVELARTHQGETMTPDSARYNNLHEWTWAR